MYMAAFPPELTRLIALAMLACAAVARAAEPATIDIDAGALHVDTTANRLLLKPVQIRQGAMSIRADEAWVSGVEINFSNTEWRFSGAVHITFDGGELDASEATAKFLGNRLQTAHATGGPATFSHTGADNDRLSRGRASTIEYNVPQGRIRLAGDVWFSDGRGEVATSAPLTYSLAGRLVDGERVQIRIIEDAVPEAPRSTPP
jgi:lipopolysaccharide transport protein LptA